MKHKIFSNDDAWMLGFTNPPLTPDKMWEDMIKPHIGSPIKGFMWSVGGHDIWDFETNIGERSDQALFSWRSFPLLGFLLITGADSRQHLRR